MNQTILKSFTPALIGVITVATVGISQSAQAGTIEAESRVSFNNAIFELNGENFWLEFEAFTESGARLFPPDNLQDGDLSLDIACPETLVTVESLASRTNSFASGGANVICNAPVGQANNFAQLALLDETVDRESATAFGGYTVSSEFELNEDDELLFSGELETTLNAFINGYTDPTGAKAEAEFLAQLIINDEDGNRVFTGSEFDNGIVIENRNGNESLVNLGTGLPFVSVTENFTIPEDGLYEITFSAVERVTGTEPVDDTPVTPIPEPSNLAGLLALGGIVFLVKRRNIH